MSAVFRTSQREIAKVYHLFNSGGGAIVQSASWKGRHKENKLCFSRISELWLLNLLFQNTEQILFHVHEGLREGRATEPIGLSLAFTDEIQRFSRILKNSVKSSKPCNQITSYPSDNIFIRNRIIRESDLRRHLRPFI